MINAITCVQLIHYVITERKRERESARDFSISFLSSHRTQEFVQIQNADFSPLFDKDMS